MPVVINEFEILQEPGAPPAGTTTPANTAAAAELSDRDVEESLRRLRRRAARVRAT